MFAKGKGKYYNPNNCIYLFHNILNRDAKKRSIPLFLVP